jgi:hypothetical protein
MLLIVLVPVPNEMVLLALGHWNIAYKPKYLRCGGPRARYLSNDPRSDPKPQGLKEQPQSGSGNFRTDPMAASRLKFDDHCKPVLWLYQSLSGVSLRGPRKDTLGE